MTAFLITLLRLSLLGSLLALVLFALKPLLRGRVSRTVSYYLWLLVLLRLCIPAGLTLTLPAREAPAAPVQVPAPAVTQTVQPAAEPSPVVSDRPAAVPAPRETQAPAEPVRRTAVLTGIWAAGALLCAGVYLGSYLRLSGKIRRSAKNPAPEALALLGQADPSGRVRLTESAAVNTPLLLGVIRPIIVLPPHLTDPARLRDILTHEFTHARRYDLLYKWFAAFASSVHWFNPLMFFIRREISRACELACDEAVIKTLDIPARQHYGETLLSLAAYAPPALALPMCGEKRNLKERLVSIVKFKKKGPLAILLTAALVLTLGACSLVSGAQAAENVPSVEYDSVYLPKTDATLQLKMTRRDIEKLLGEGVYWYIDDPWTTNDGSIVGGSVGYQTQDGVVVLEYSNHTVVGISFLAELDDNPSMGLSPEAQAMLAEPIPFQVQVSDQTIRSGDTVEQLRSAFPAGVRSVFYGKTFYELFGDNTAAAFQLSEASGVTQLQLWPSDRWGYLSGTDFFSAPALEEGNPSVYAGLFVSMDQTELEECLEAFGPGQETDGSSLYGSGAYALNVTYVDGIDAYPDDHDCILEAIGSAWVTARGIHVGSTLADAEACYDGKLYTDQSGRYFQAEGKNFHTGDGFRLILRLSEEHVITSMTLIRTGTSAWATNTDQAGLSLPDSAAVIYPGMSQAQAEALLGQGELIQSKADVDGSVYADPENPSVYQGQSLYDASLPDTVYNYGSGEDILQVSYQDGIVCAVLASSTLTDPAALPSFRWQTEEGLGYGSTLAELKAHYKNRTITKDMDLATYLYPNENLTATLFDVQEENCFLQFALLDDQVFMVNLVSSEYKDAWDAWVRCRHNERVPVSAAAPEPPRLRAGGAALPVEAPDVGKYVGLKIRNISG